MWKPRAGSFLLADLHPRGLRIHKRFAGVAKSVFVHRVNGVVIFVSPSGLSIVVPCTGVSSCQGMAQPLPFGNLLRDRKSSRGFPSLNTRTVRAEC